MKSKLNPQLRILSSRPLLQNHLRSSLRVSLSNFFTFCKERSTKMYVPSFGDRSPIVSVQAVDDFILFNEASVTVWADPRGIKLNDTILQFLYSLVSRSHTVNIFESVLGGFDARVRSLKGVIPISLGDYILSDGKALVYVIVDYLDRKFYAKEKGKIFVERPGHGGKPRVYKNLSVPKGIYEGNHPLIRNKLEEDEGDNSRVS